LGGHDVIVRERHEPQWLRWWKADRGTSDLRQRHTPLLERTMRGLSRQYRGMRGFEHESDLQRQQLGGTELHWRNSGMLGNEWEMRRLHHWIGFDVSDIHEPHILR
jgi:hypothetical protein